MNKTNLKTMQELPSSQKRRNYFKNQIIYEYNQNKDEIKGQTLQNGMTITGIGEKCIKVGNNFIEWDDIFFTIEEEQEPQTQLMKAIFEFIFEDYKEDKEEEQYTPRKFTREETLADFEKVKDEIITHKEMYKKGPITGIGEKAVMTGKDYWSEFTGWDKIEKTLKENTIKDIKLISRDPEIREIIPELFTDDEEETETEKQIREKEEKYAEEKYYVYRHIVADDLRVENIRAIIYNRYNRGDAEEIINEVIQYAFQYLKEIKFTDDDYDEEEANKYVIKDGDKYIYVIKNKQITYNEEKQAYHFEGYMKATFKAKDYNIQIYRYGKKVAEKPAMKPIYVLRRKTTTIPLAYELSVKQQHTILEKSGNIQKIDEDEIKENFIKTANAETEIGEQIREATKNYASVEEAYTKSKLIRTLGREIYSSGQIHDAIFYHQIAAIIAEQEIDQRIIKDALIWADSDRGRIILDDRYGFGSDRGVTTEGYVYTQNCEYTRIEESSAHIDSVSGIIVYLSGDVPFEKAKRYVTFCEGACNNKKAYRYKGGIIIL